MSFEDEQYVDMDYDDGMFYITSNSGGIRAYRISDEPDLYRNIMDSHANGELEVFVLESEDAQEKDEQWEKFTTEVKDEYKEKYGENFEDWSW